MDGSWKQRKLLVSTSRSQSTTTFPTNPAEPPYADPHVRWCDRGKLATAYLCRFRRLIQSGFVTRSLTLALLWMVLCAGCTRLPESFPPPEQRVPLTVPRSGALGYYFSMADPNADAYLVKDVADSGPGTWRWVYDHPVLRFLDRK